MSPKTVPAPKPLRDEVLTIPEIAWLTNSKRSTVERWRIRNRDADQPSRAETFPEPDDRAGSTPVWRANRVLIWLELNRPKLDVRTLDEWREHKAAGGFLRKPEVD